MTICGSEAARRQRSAPCTSAPTNFILVQSRSEFAACWSDLSDLCAGRRTRPIDQRRMSHRLPARGAAPERDHAARDHRLCARRQRLVADPDCARRPRFSCAVDTLVLALNEEWVMYLSSSRCRRSREESPCGQLLGWRVQGRGVNDLKSTTSCSAVAVEGAVARRKANQASAWRLGFARNRQTESDPSSNEIRLDTLSARVWARHGDLDGPALRRLERRHSAKAPNTPPVGANEH